MPHSWDSFFVLAGGTAATLMGLLFVAVTVGGTGFSTSRIMDGTRGFLTPALVHFGTVLLQALAQLVTLRTLRHRGRNHAFAVRRHLRRLGPHVVDHQEPGQDIAMPSLI
jgi:hypothetical protein